MVTTKQKTYIDTQRTKRRNLSTPLQKIIKSQRKRARQEERNKEITKQLKNNEQNGNKRFIPSIIILNVN